MSSISKRIVGWALSATGRTWRSASPVLLCAGSWCVLFLSGCGAPVAKFEPNLVYRHKQEQTAGEKFPATQTADLQAALTALFGTPDDPNAPLLADIDTSTVINKGKLALSAGPVKSDKEGHVTGLYRKHCVHCHGITGDGKGPRPPRSIPIPATSVWASTSSSRPPRGASRPTMT